MLIGRLGWQRMHETGDYRKAASSEILLDVHEVPSASASSSSENPSSSSHPVLAPESYSSSTLSSCGGSIVESHCGVFRRCICGKQLAYSEPLERDKFVQIHPKWIHLSRYLCNQRRSQADLRRSIFVTISSGNFIPEIEIKHMFSRLGKVLTVRWCQFGLSNGYMVTFNSREQMLNTLKVTGNRVETNGCLLTIKWANPKRIKWRLCTSLAARIVKSRTKRLKISSSNMAAEETWPIAVSVDKLNNIFTNHLQIHPAKDQSENTDSSQCIVKTGPLDLPAPYHLLPDTPYFRKALIVPPPVRGPTVIKRPPLLTRIIGLYLASMIADDERCLESIAQMQHQFHAERKTHKEQATAPATITKEFVADIPLHWLHDSEHRFPSQMPTVQLCSQPLNVHINQEVEESSRLPSKEDSECGIIDMEPYHMNVDWKTLNLPYIPSKVSNEFRKTKSNSHCINILSQIPTGYENRIWESGCI